MKLTGKIIDVSLDYLTNKPKITFQLKNQYDILNDEFNKLCNQEEIDIEICEHKEHRSNDANAYCWVLCQKIAEVVNSTKINVYRKAISEVGQFEILPLKNEAVNTFINAWQKKGIGWICQGIGESKFRGFTNVVAYYGSSIYDKKSMSKLINWLVEEARGLGIRTLEDIEIDRLIEEWDK